MPEVQSNGLTIHYDEHGDASNPALLLVMGLGAQMTLWPTELVEALVAKGFRVMRYDNRDVGLSDKMDGAKAPGLPWQLLRKKIGFPAKVPYTLKDMADDGIGVLDALGIAKAHVVGGSMGGMIAQLMAIHHGDRLLSLTSIFSTTGSSKLPQADDAAMQALIKPTAGMNEAELIENGMALQLAIGSPGFRPTPEAARERATGMIQRSHYPAGLPRQLAAIIDDGDRTSRLAGVTTPTLVLHGEDDPLVKVEAGHATAAAIPGAKIKTIAGWGHDLPIALADELASAIAEHANSVSVAEAA